jgi:hypothetical protein
MNVAWNVNANTAAIMAAAAKRPNNDCAAKRNSRLPKSHRFQRSRLHKPIALVDTVRIEKGQRQPRPKYA